MMSCITSVVPGTSPEKAVFFDMDGVLLDSMPCHVQAWQEAMGEFGCAVDEEVLYLHEGAIEPETAIRIFQDHGFYMDEARFAAILARQMAIFQERFRPHVQPYPEVPGIIARLREEGWTMALVTSSHGAILDQILPHEIRDALNHIVTGDRVSRRKPHPDPYIAALHAIGSDAASSLVVENAPAGIAAAKAAGLHCIALATTLAPERLSAADAVLTSHRELLAYLSSWDAGRVGMAPSHGPGRDLEDAQVRVWAEGGEDRFHDLYGSGQGCDGTGEG